MIHRSVDKKGKSEGYKLGDESISHQQKTIYFGRIQVGLKNL